MNAPRECRPRSRFERRLKSADKVETWQPAKPRPIADSSSDIVQEGASAWAESAECLEANGAEIDARGNGRVFARLLFFSELGGRARSSCGCGNIRGRARVTYCRVPRHLATAGKRENCCAVGRLP